MENNSPVDITLFKFMAHLRAVPFKRIQLKPEPVESTLDWPYEDKYDFHIQAYALNALEKHLDKKLTAKEFKVIYEEKLQLDSELLKQVYSFQQMNLFSISLEEDNNGDIYHLFTPLSL